MAPLLQTRPSDPHHYIETPQQLAQFAQDNQAIAWMGFDTEFINEKRFYPMLCLIQVVTEQGLYIIDPLRLDRLDPFLALIENPQILKITHAGDNDYRLLNALYGTYPKNLFDTQIATGFLTHTYPISFQNLIEKEFRITLNKSFAVTNWEARPLTSEQLSYALNDVIYLPELWERMTAQLEKLDRLPWFQEEVAKLEAEQYYASDTVKDMFRSTLHTQMNPQERIFLVRLMYWCREEAKARNITKDMVLPSKTMVPIAKGMGQGKSALHQNRMISDKLIQTHWGLWSKLFKDPMTPEEKAMLKEIPKWQEETPEQAMSTEFLYLLIRDRCFKAQIAPTIVCSKSSFRSKDKGLDSGWRRTLLGESLIEWIHSKKKMAFDVQGDRCVVKFVE
ncbi:MAG: ribonuclease D [Alkalinema sp. RU_4_3]|nr:ribonuclease D [Alkalinema sp. RU_4_3]